MKEMIMPHNYVELEQVEMMYLDGGGQGWNGMELYWWGFKLNLSKSTINTLGAGGYGMAGKYLESNFKAAGGVKGLTIAFALGAAGYMASNMSSGVWIRYTYGAGLTGFGRL